MSESVQDIYETFLALLSMEGKFNMEMLIEYRSLPSGLLVSG
jgi:hypothetical protein